MIIPYKALRYSSAIKAGDWGSCDYAIDYQGG